jgi:PAS domain S-box-containing protein
MDVLKDILDNLNDSIIIIDAYGQVVLFNNEARRIQKSISEEPIEVGEYYTTLVDEGHRPTVQEILKTLKRQKKPLKNFAEYQTPFGNSVFLEINFIPVLGSKKELKYVNIITQDITSRKISEKKIRAAAADVRNLLEHAHAFICSVDSRGYIVEWNSHCTDITGYSKREILSKKFSEALMSEGNVPLFNDLMSAVLENRPPGSFELPLQTEKGEVIVMVSATPKKSTEGQVVGATLVGHDITELSAYRRSLEKLVENKTAALQEVLEKEKEAVEMKSRFVSIASHEFRTPLSSIDFAASFIKQNAATIGKRKLNEKVRVIEKHVSHMSHLLEDVLNFSKNDNGGIRLIPSRVCLESFVVNAVEEVTCSIRHSHHICVSTSRLGFLVTDEKLLRNIVINLLSNAVKFSPGREEVSLNVLDEDERVTIEVRDDGMGIPEDEIDKIFDPFVRGKAAASIQGTGLGLSIVKKAVELLDGTIVVKSAPGCGSVFKVTIPRRQHLN